MRAFPFGHVGDRAGRRVLPQCFSTPERHLAHGYILELRHFHTRRTGMYEMKGNETNHLIMPWATCVVTGFPWEVAGSPSRGLRADAAQNGGVVVPITGPSTG